MRKQVEESVAPGAAAASSSAKLVEAPGWVGLFRPGPILHLPKILQPGPGEISSGQTAP